MIIYLIGFMGCGKTTLGKKIAHKLNVKFLDMDTYIENKQQQTLTEIFECQGEEKFRTIEHTTLKHVSAKKNYIIATGGGLPCFFNNMKIMNETGTTVYLKIAPNYLAKRLSTGRTKRPLIKNKTEKELILFIKETLEKREIYYKQAQYIIKKNNIKPQNIIDAITTHPLIKRGLKIKMI